MMPHSWLAPSVSVAAKLARARAASVLRKLSTVPLDRLGRHVGAWRSLAAALPTLLRIDAGRLLAVVGRVDVLTVLLELADEGVDGRRLDRALATLWLGIAGHPGLVSPLALTGPFSELLVDPNAPRLLMFGDVRGLVATQHGPVVIGQTGRHLHSMDSFTRAQLPTVGATVVVGEGLGVPDPIVLGRVQIALAAVSSALPGGQLERVTIGTGDAVDGEARVSPDSDPADLVASAQAAFTRAATAVEPALDSGGVLVETGRRVSPNEILARVCGNAVALPWRRDRAQAEKAILDDLENIAAIADPTPNGASLVAAVRALVGNEPVDRRRALLINIDADDFVYSFQFGRSIERRCVERNLRVDRISIAGGRHRDLAGEIGGPIPAPIVDGTETFVDSDDDPLLLAALARLRRRRYELIVANVRPRLFFDLATSGMFAVPTLLWDRHLHNGFREERTRRGPEASRIRGESIQVWSTFGKSDPKFKQPFVEAGLERTRDHAWPMDLEFFRSTVKSQANRLFAGGNSGRDWPLFAQAIRGLPLDVHLVTSQVPAALPPNVHTDRHLSLWRFRDAMAASTVVVIPITDPRLAAGVTVLTMAMALGVAVVATDNIWIAEHATDGEEALLVPAGDVGAFREAVLRLYDDANLRSRLVANARRRVAALCDIEGFTRAMFATVG